MAAIRGRQISRTSIATTPAFKRVKALVDAAQSLQSAYNLTKDNYVKYFTYSVSVSERDSLYVEAHDWLLNALPNEKHRTLSVSTSRSTTSQSRYEYASDTVEDAEKPKPLKVKFNDNAVRTVHVEGHPIRVSLSRPEAPSDSNSLRAPEYATINFVARSHAGQQAVLRQLEKLNAQRATTRKAVLKMVNQWGSWNTRSDLPPRTLESVALPEDQKQRIITDLDTFLKAEDQYNRLAIPWHRGYMLYGPPGTGKTSMVKALANHFNMDLWYVSLSDLTAESSLLQLLADVGPRSILLLEDIDTMKITHDRDGAEQGKISMSSLLNTLDGVATPHGLVTMMTTNRFDILDSALKRPGRMDLVEELSYPTLTTLGNMYHHFFGKHPEWDALGDPDTQIENLSTGEIAEILKRHMSDADAASQAVVQKLESIRENAAR